MKYKKTLATILIMILGLALFGCEKGVDLENNEDKQGSVEVSYEPEYGGNMNVPISNVKTFNPLINREKSLYHFYKLIYEALFEFDEDFNIKGQLCKTYQIENEGRLIRLTLRDDVYWHDGVKFTAKDVKFTLDAMRYSSREGLYNEILTDVFKPSKPSDIKQIMSANIINDYVIEIKLNRNYSNSLEALMFPILPMHQFTNKQSADRSDYDKAFNENYIKTPIGTGPYKFDKYEKLKYVGLSANDKWYKGKPYIQNISGIIVDSEETALSSFETGLVDLAFAVGIDWDKYLENKKVNIYEYTTNKYEFIGFNFNKEIFQGVKGQSLRKAIDYAINKQVIVDNVFLRHAKIADTPINPNSWLYDKDTNLLKYNINEARDILQKAGFKDTNDDGILEDTNGKKLQIRLLTNSYNQLRTEMADIIVNDLKEIGIEVIKDYNSSNNLSEQEIATQWERLNNKLSKREFDMVLLGWDLSLVPDLSFMLHSSQIDNGTNFISYNHIEMDNLLMQAFLAQDRETKRESYINIQKLISEDLPYVSLLFKNKAILVNNKIMGDIKPETFNLYYNIDKWFIPKKYQDIK
ncbi:ABC transporter substrate-binding protein [Abyssisolibacter fermentans]|uniref:ABC transporter substrate-binding protein n=1 Tax=Abyssisolibacter fermentans TaxID=1766203 RepID=UPI00082FB0A8|nr:ABC transporter substrate-binding protein [Abyssisolibacter fermentans]